MSDSEAKLVSVFVPTLNAARTIGECLDGVFNQQLPAGYELEVLVTDSGSTDATVAIIRRSHPRVKLVSIPNAEFTHGGTRADALRRARGRFVAFLTQDATPRDRFWLARLIEPFFLSPAIACVFGLQVPRWDAPLTIKREVTNAFASLGPSIGMHVHREYSLLDRSRVAHPGTFFSNVNAAVRRDLTLEQVPFPRVDYAEDQALVGAVLERGYAFAYAPEAAVIHSNQYSPLQYFFRKFDEYIALHDHVRWEIAASGRRLLTGWLQPTLGDYKFLARDGGYTPRLRMQNVVTAPLYNLAREAGNFCAAMAVTRPQMRRRLSLERRIRRRAQPARLDDEAASESGVQ